MASLKRALPDAEAMLALEPEELAGYLLEYLNGLPEREREGLNRYSFSLPDTVREYPPEHQEALRLALTEAWMWLEREGLLVPKPGTQFEWRVVSRRGKTFKHHGDVEAFRKANLLPRGLLHPSIAAKVWSEFLRGDYETAVFQAFKEVEVAARAASGLADTDFGVDLMRKAFHADRGPLTDLAVVPAERQARSDLFAGAIGSYKNPSSHRTVKLEAGEAVEELMLASHLLRLVDRSAAAKRGSVGGSP